MAEELTGLCITALSRRIHEGTLSPIELMEAVLTRTERLDPGLNAFRPLDREGALRGAQAAQMALAAGDDRGPLHGIPFAVKDIIDVRGWVTTAGSNALSNNVADTDATVVSRLREAGMVLAGKTQTVQFALGATGINHDHGTPHNPWAREHHVPGGSSSGSGVAVAARMVPMALGTDTGGSVRIPAALCGTVGLKTTVGQVSRAGVFPLSSTLDSVGPLSRSVEDAAFAYQAMHGRDVRDRSTAGAISQDVTRTLRAGLAGLRIGVPDSFFWDEVDPQVDQAVRAAIDLLADQGAIVTPLSLPEAAEAEAANPNRIISSVEACYAHEEILGPDFAGYDRALAHRIGPGREASGTAYLRACEQRIEIAQRAHARLADVDAFATPSTLLSAAPLATVDVPENFTAWTRKCARNTGIGNLLGLTALSVPCGFTDTGLPIGLMIHAKPRNEPTVLRIGYAYEQATDWHRQEPDLSWV